MSFKGNMRLPIGDQ